MSLEGQTIDKKSLRAVTGKSADFPELAKDCVAFANAQGGRLQIGIEDDAVMPSADQRILPELLDTIRKRIAELTVNVVLLPSIVQTENGGEYIDLAIHRSQGVASTTDGRYFIRVGDSCLPVVGDDVMRLADERPGRPWETMDSRVSRGETDSAKFSAFVAEIRASDRAKDSVKEKSADELLTHYGLADGATLTHLGVLLLGTSVQRRNLGTAPMVQAIKYDELGQKINKWLWDDYALSPVELVDAVWREVQDFRESYEIAEGLYRRQVPAFDEKVVRELLVNALVHRPYTQRGDIFLNLHPDRLEVVNPGRLPLGVTPQNILHASRRRNDGLASVFHDLGLMEKEGSGYDMLYDRLLSSGRPAPVPEEGADWVKVTIKRRIMKPEVIKLVTDADSRYQLAQRERITLAALAQHEGLTARELATIFEVGTTDELAPWFGRLLALGLVQSTGRTQATRYFVDPNLLRDSGIRLPTTLKRIEPHRLLELVREDLRRYPNSKIGEISERIGSEVSRSQLKRALAELVKLGAVLMVGERNGARYNLASK
ncbi:MAG: ATP-binding protein [Desulfuromonadaceae bacterium]|nr:ATP-binding protein [Desulfuromonadaceae bacterium]MDD2849645.1 ATP-binding protein [Desulfuromonadaceae bacterium]MDD4131683.1 ATP-binding protein [Desulfuromonadaceae bacterium]